MSNEIKLSKETIDILKNFSGISGQFRFRPGNEISVVNRPTSWVGIATVAETFPIDFAIVDMNVLLSCISYFKEPSIVFENTFLLVKETNSSSDRMRFYYANPESVKCINKTPKIPDNMISFSLPNDIYMKMMKFHALLSGNGGSPSISLSNPHIEGKLMITVGDTKNKSSNTYDVQVNGRAKNDADFLIVFPPQNMAFMKGDYEVEIYVGKGPNDSMSIFSNTNGKLKYFVAPDISSKMLSK